MVETHYCEDGYLASNLLLNAADAIPPSGKIQLRVRRAHEWSGKARGGIRATFADNGRGITSHELRNILLPFYSTKGGALTKALGSSKLQRLRQNAAGKFGVRWRRCWALTLRERGLSVVFGGT
ncbi:MAG: ATP-binding protein [Acidobacteriaceae bacterium]